MANGLPTGGEIKQSGKASSDYLRFADDTRMCTNSNTATTTATASFTGPTTKSDGDKLWIGR